MSMLRFFKENFVLSLGVFLPVLLMGVFFVSAQLQAPPALKQADIRHDIVFSDYGGTGGNTSVNASVFVEKDNLYVQYTRTQQGAGNIPRLYIYEATSGKMRQLDFSPPDTTDESVFGRKIPVESARGLKIDTSLTSPDGFEFTYDRSYRGGGGMINELFIGGGRNNYGPQLKRGKSYFPLPTDATGGYYYGQLRFIGWVVGRTQEN